MKDEQMKLIAVWLGALILTLGAVNLWSQNTVVVHQKPMLAQMLAGTVRVGHGGEVARAVRVEQCTRNWKDVKSSTLTDDNGHFEFTTVPEGIYYLRFVGPDLTTTLITVRIRKSAPRELSITIRTRPF